MLQNWDFYMHRVSKESASVIDEIVSIPMLHMTALAPELHLYVGSLDKVRKLRHQLSGLCRYLNACKKVAEAEGWHRAISKFKNKEYLLEHTDIYSVQDLVRVHMSLMVPELKDCVNEGISHVKSCSVCQGQAFICEICNQGPALFPFQVDRIWKCPKCSSVYHLICKPATTHCPRCLRLSSRRHTATEPLNVN
ncbi:hypothetical protein LOD99_1123 [Oopsacas minuta]|uniref:Rubicon Homology domain-containing protein n=1 Tax=Oopsacas minuta TaxID=111878 RepID=A0AAV7K637_9METZ|nr:hypothetical protein LOD99_1100 [Oopsacas minuta]KAI6656323.1 hypothetical protein LOD99_1123 [Oopsacas minuta]